jgi:hypothetical protein
MNCWLSRILEDVTEVRWQGWEKGSFWGKIVTRINEEFFGDWLLGNRAAINAHLKQYNINVENSATPPTSPVASPQSGGAVLPQAVATPSAVRKMSIGTSGINKTS